MVLVPSVPVVQTTYYRRYLLLFELWEEGKNMLTQRYKSDLNGINFDSLSYEFSKTFRVINTKETVKEIEKRNREYFIWSKLLRECVLNWGLRWYTYCWNDVKSLYHGINKPLYFN